MKCRYCNFELEDNYRYYHHSMSCKGCGTDFLFRPEEFSTSSKKIVNGTEYSVIYLSCEDTTYVYKIDLLVCAIDGEMNPHDIFKRVGTIRVFS